ncbi:MAG: bifunctional uridylyltransferase/uridylyl-removing protein, partial [Edaphobacter sp.]
MSSNESMVNGLRGRYQARTMEIRDAFHAGASGAVTIAARTKALDELASGLWAQEVQHDPRLADGVSLVAVGGYGRAELFPYSDVDLLFLLDGRLAEKDVKDAIRRVTQEMWDSGIRVSPVTRRLAECERFDGENAEFAIALMDRRLITGDLALYKKLATQTIPKMLQREHQSLMAGLTGLTRARHAKYGDTLFHLEPNIKDCPGGLRDIHVCNWMAALREIGPEAQKPMVGERGDDHEFRQAVEFLSLVRCFLHYRHGRDDNLLDWQAQDMAAEAGIGIGIAVGAPANADAAYWMRFYFRHARRIERRVARIMDEAPMDKPRLKLLGLRRERRTEPSQQGFRVERGRVALDALITDALITDGGRGVAHDPAQDPDVVLDVFEAMART